MHLLIIFITSFLFFLFLIYRCIFSLFFNFHLLSAKHRKNTKQYIFFSSQIFSHLNFFKYFCFISFVFHLIFFLLFKLFLPIKQQQTNIYKCAWIVLMLMFENKLKILSILFAICYIIYPQLS